MGETATERLTATAARLFQERGLTRVGINEIIREADVARMSLYNNFSSKRDLAVAAYARVSSNRLEAVDAIIRASAGPADAILAIFDLAVELAGKPSFRGCAFIDLAAHAGAGDEPLMDLARSHKLLLRERFERLALDLGDPAPQTLARQLLTLWDGAFVGAFIESDVAPVLAARAAAAKLVAREDR
ncbi:TetR/AcrR family transcriptional regulator [Stappia sp.]|uniref:TetR/AcrR family transcriptional regulator n=1 Tax=Stappia sp. TaxID=1870903 RepID=UPI003A9A5A2F